jgi:hypothetical protein
LVPSKSWFLYRVLLFRRCPVKWRSVI